MYGLHNTVIPAYLLVLSLRVIAACIGYAPRPTAQMSGSCSVICVVGDGR